MLQKLGYFNVMQATLRKSSKEETSFKITFPSTSMHNMKTPETKSYDLLNNYHFTHAKSKSKAVEHSGSYA